MENNRGGFCLFACLLKIGFHKMPQHLVRVVLDEQIVFSSGPDTRAGHVLAQSSVSISLFNQI